MKRKTPKRDKDGYEYHPFGKNARFGKPVADFLPSPEVLIARNPNLFQETTSVPLSLSKTSFDYFKRRAKREKTTPQAVIAAFIEQHLPVR